MGAIILAGGQSRRMGTSKADLQIGNETMLERITRILLNVVSPVVVVCAPNQNKVSTQANVIFAFDSVEDEGPLRGLQAGLLALPKSVERVFVTGCDAPGLNPQFISSLFSSSEAGQAWVPEIDGMWQPIPAVYRTDILPLLTDMLNEGQRSLKGLLRRVDTCIVAEDIIRKVDPHLMSFDNVNTPSDYQRILRLYQDAT